VDREKVIKDNAIRGLQSAIEISGAMVHLRKEHAKAILALLKEQEAKERKWLQTIADNQIANAPNDSPMSLDEQLESEYKSGIYDGLQMAFEILMEGR